MVNLIEISKSKPHFTILGAGIAGLAVGYYARNYNLPFTIYDAHNRIGGNSITLNHNGFLFDSGAHRFHDRNREVTSEIVKIMGEELSEINVPSQIYYGGRFFDFPLSPLNLMRGLGFLKFIQAGVEILQKKINKIETFDSFASFAVQTYGETIAERFLLNYSEKLWGRSSKRLSSEIAGKRLEGLTLKTFLIEALLGRHVKTKHIDGAFYYPSKGIGRISEKLGKFCGEENIVLDFEATKVFHNYQRITAVEFNHDVKLPVEQMICTIPLPVFLNMMEPAPSQEILNMVRDLKFRCMILTAFFLNKESVSKNASIYFPDRTVSFTRIYEPKMRSQNMSPLTKTSLIAELPCQMEDDIWKKSDQSIIDEVKEDLCEIGMIVDKDIIDAQVHRMHYAYPILEIGYKKKLQIIFDFLKRYANLQLSGRNGRFAYVHIHDIMKSSKEIINEFI